MANTTFKGPVRSENGFLEWNGSAWVPVQGGGGGGGGTTFVFVSSENRYTDDAYADPPTGTGAGNVIELPVIEVGETYTITTGFSAGGSDAWALQFPAIPGTDITAYYGYYNVKSVGGGSPLITVLNEYCTPPTGPTDTFYIYGFINTPMQIIRMEDLVVPGFGTVASFQQIVPPSMNITQYPDPFVYPFTNLITP